MDKEEDLAVEGDFGGTLRPSQTKDHVAFVENGEEDNEEVEQLDPRANDVSRVPVYVDIPAETLRVILDSALRAYNEYVLIPTRTTWRKEEGGRRELERDVERTSLRELAQFIKKDVTAKLGGSWHVIYGRDFATYVTHKRMSFCHFQIDGADVVVWRHGG
ncbi:hypothetical protein AGDE_03680 [Angomonas deanei]|uniref:Dynein light chain type 1, putative n=1 Tax=Angomonas deanei TaxID=59799 RepID=A0A7G2CAB8_9TRYP|nr:hypothetical protein AGDE_03680 [Angomonas deanei]CAD2216718.1 Dynein light chain type 1, putative [Angomonas deanei]|eukprot:EPY40248.1 hypothetical protein AGDE_03680 [Angomonas deanei]